MKLVGYFITTLLILATSASWSKGQNLRIEIVGDGLTERIVITDPEILGLFNIWNGPGVTVRGPDGVPYPPAHLDSDKSHGRFIDWPKGMAPERPSGLQRLEVTFVLGVPRRPDEERSYIFAYEVDTRALGGFIYLPRWMNNLIAHRVEGNWFYATARWNEVIAPIIVRNTKELPTFSERGDLSCIAGYALLEADGTIDLKRFDEQGRNVLHYRYDTSSDVYDDVRDHIGDMKTGEQIEASCWPPRL